MDAMKFVLLVLFQLAEFSDAFPRHSIGRSPLLLCEMTSPEKEPLAFDQSNEGESHSSSSDKFYDSLNTSEKTKDEKDAFTESFPKLPGNWQATHDCVDESNEKYGSDSVETEKRELRTFLFPKNFQFTSIRARESRKVPRTWPAMEQSKIFICEFPAIVPAMPSKFPKRNDFIVNMSKVGVRIETAISLTRRGFKLEPTIARMTRVDTFTASRAGFEKIEPMQSIKTDLVESGAVDDNASQGDIADSPGNPSIIPSGKVDISLAVMEDVVHYPLISDRNTSKAVIGATTDPIVENAGTIDVSLAIVEDVVHDSHIPQSCDDNISKPVIGGTTDPIVENAGTIDGSLVDTEDVVRDSFIPESSNHNISKSVIGSTTDTIAENGTMFVDDVNPLGTSNNMSGVLSDSDINSSAIVDEAKECHAGSFEEESAVQETDAGSLLEKVLKAVPFLAVPLMGWQREPMLKGNTYQMKNDSLWGERAGLQQPVN